jgi:hypothetical protein
VEIRYSCPQNWCFLAPEAMRCRLSVPIRGKLTSGHWWVSWRYRRRRGGCRNPRRGEHDRVRDAPAFSASIYEGWGEMLTVIRLGLPAQLRRSLGCTNREPDGSAAAGLPERQTLCTDGIAMDRNRNAGSREELPAFEGAQTASDSERLCCDISKRCSLSQLPAKIGQLNIQPIAPAAPFSTGTGTIRDVVFQLLC